MQTDLRHPGLYEERPKTCMNGWANLFLDITPDGTALPCHSARQLPVAFPNVREHSLSHIWNDSFGFNRFRGDDWMKEPCRSCDEKHKDLGGCRCQAFMLTGDAANADPVCSKSPHHERDPQGPRRSRGARVGDRTPDAAQCEDFAADLSRLNQAAQIPCRSERLAMVCQSTPVLLTLLREQAALLQWIWVNSQSGWRPWSDCIRSWMV